MPARAQTGLFAADLFGTDLFEPGSHQLLEDGEGGVCYRPGFIGMATAQQWFDALHEGIAWQAQRRPMYDRVVDVPRLVAAYQLDDPALPAPLPEAAALLRAETGEPFNAVGLNYYRDGRDSVAPHNDKLHSLIAGHPIALLSLGAPRRMTIRAKPPRRHVQHIYLQPGSLLLMSYASQLHYEHGIPKTRDPVGPRISLAFRVRPVKHA